MKYTTDQLYFGASALKSGYNRICDPQNSALLYLHFGRLYLPEPKATYAGETGEHEVVFALLHGSGSVQVEGGATYQIGLRVDPFSGPATMLYLPPQTRYQVTAGTQGLDMAVNSAEAQAGGAPLLLTPDKIAVTQHGAGRWARKVHLGTVGDFAIQRLMVGETYNRPGGWTSFPSHKHDSENPPQEMPYEEIYFFQMKPQGAFAVQCLYDSPDREDALNEAFMVRDGDTVVLPRGYHPVAGSPGCQMYYLWAMCGAPGLRTYGQVTVDPQFAWLHQVEPLLDDFPWQRGMATL